MQRVFISHATADADLVDEFTDFLENAVRVDPQDIFCSSRKGQGIQPGVEFKEAIREALRDADVTIALISSNYYNSAFCMCELGGVWLASKRLIPILIPPVDYGDMRAVLRGLQALKINSDSDLDQLRDVLAHLLGLKQRSTPQWNSRRKKFLRVVKQMMENTKFPEAVSPDKVAFLQSQIEEYENSFEKLEERYERLSEKYSRLKKTKDATEVQALEAEYSDEEEGDNGWGEFEELISIAKSALAQLGSSVVEALYYETRGSRWAPNRDEWDAAQQEEEEGFLDIVDGEVTTNSEHRKVREAKAALQAIEDWLEQCPEEFYDEYSEEYDLPPQLSRRPFWQEHLL